MDQDLAQKAISSALAGNWEKALKINLEILKKNPQDINALNRTARAYAELGKTKKAKNTTQKTLKIDPLNTIAIKSLEKWKKIPSKEAQKTITLSAQAFLEEPGKTKMVKLIHLGAPQVIAQLDPGEEVQLACHQHRVSVLTHSGKYTGRLPDDLAAHYRKLIKQGSEFQALIKSADKQGILIFIRETEGGNH